MDERTRPRLVPYEMVEPGTEAIYTGETLPTPDDSTDGQGNVISKAPTWTWVGKNQERMWGDEVGFVRDGMRYLNQMQAELGPLSDDTRQIRYHIGTLFPCDSGIPVTVDELLSDAVPSPRPGTPRLRL